MVFVKITEGDERGSHLGIEQSRKECCSQHRVSKGEEYRSAGQGDDEIPYLWGYAGHCTILGVF